MDRRVARTRRNIFYAFFRLVQTKPIDEITPRIKTLAADMIETMRAA